MNPTGVEISHHRITEEDLARMLQLDVGLLELINETVRRDLVNSATNTLGQLPSVWILADGKR